jgi:hypothetical protein
MVAKLLSNAVRFMQSLNKAKHPFTKSRLTAVEKFVSYAIPLIAKGQVKGILEVFHRARIKIMDEKLH